MYPDPSFYGLNAPFDLSQPHQPAPAAAPSVPTAAPVPAPSAPPFAIDPALLALPGPAASPYPAPIVATADPILPPIAGPVLAPFAGAPRLSVSGVMFPGFPAGLVPPMEINGGDAAKYNNLVAGTIVQLVTNVEKRQLKFT